MLWRRCGTGSSGCVLCKAESRDGPKKKCFSYKNAAVPAPERHVPSKSLAVLRLRRRSPLKGCTLFAPWTSSVGKNTWSEESSVTFVAAFSCDLAKPERYTDALGHKAVLGEVFAGEVSGSYHTREVNVMPREAKLFLSSAGSAARGFLRVPGEHSTSMDKKCS